MALISIIKDFHPINDEHLLAVADSLMPTLFHELREAPVQDRPIGKGESIYIDFGEHVVGRLTLSISFSGSHPDAPAYLKLRFAETLRELEEDSKALKGWLSHSWIQEEIIHADLVPSEIPLPRRYAFRYVKITILDTSPKYRLKITRAVCDTETSADLKAVRPLHSGDVLLDHIHAASLKTLADCMQRELEDGPKRDRRLWLGDLRLQALTDYVSFRNYDIVKRSLYLFGGSRFPDGRVSANVFARPVPEADDTFLFDYALMFPVVLEEYLRETGDTEALDDLYDIAMLQVEYALTRQNRGEVDAKTIKETFIDWSDTLDRSACAAGVILYSMRYALDLAYRKGDMSKAEQLREQRDSLRANVMEKYWDGSARCFVSNGQISAASQSWLTLADAGTPEQSRLAMKKALTLTGAPRMTTPYMHHYFVMALLHAGMRDEAEAHLKDYWGGMLSAGADTFWECWDPEHPDHSPYGGLLLNSYCHAWSCTPAYIIEKYLVSDVQSGND